MRKTFLFALILGLAGCSFFQSLDQRLVSENQKVRTKAMAKLTALSADKKIQLISPLIEKLRNPESRIANRAADALVIIGAPIIDQLKPLLKDPDAFVRANAVSILGRLGPYARGAIAEITECLKDPHPLVREEATLAIAKLG